MKISLVVPVYNEEEAIPIFHETIRNIMAEPSFANDRKLKEKSCANI